jgi:hypothetical protein
MQDLLPCHLNLDAVHCIVSRAFMLVIWRGPRLVGYIGTSRSGTVINHREVNLTDRWRTVTGDL